MAIENFKPNTDPEKKKGVPVFITNRMRADLKSFGATDAEIDKMRPAEAWELLEKKQAEQNTAPETESAREQEGTLETAIAEREKIEADLELDDKMGKLAPAEFAKSYEERFELDEKILSLNQEKNNRSRDSKTAEEQQKAKERAGEEQQEPKNLDERIERAGLKAEELEKMPEWQSLSAGEKALVVEQVSQDTLTRVREIGEKSFKEKNKVNFSADPTKWNPFQLGKKIARNMGKSYGVDKEEKKAITDFKEGRLRPKAELVKELAENIKGLNLNVTEKDGKASIEFVPTGEYSSKREQKAAEDYNRIANEYARMPDAWKNKRAADSMEKGMSKKKNFESYTKAEIQYRQARAVFLEVKAKEYRASGSSPEEAKEKAMQEMNMADMNIAMLQLGNTNPDAIEELRKIEKQSSWKKLLTRENAWRVGYMGIGYTARAATASTLGLLAAPIVAGSIGGLRARRKAEGKIGSVFESGRKEETVLERKKAGKKFQDKTTMSIMGTAKEVLTGFNVNTKDVAAFVDADQQIKRLDMLMGKLEKAQTKEDKALAVNELSTRVSYIEQKHDKGLLNYGTQSPTGTGYALLKRLSEASVAVKMNTFDLKEIPSELIEVPKETGRGTEKVELRDLIKRQMQDRADLLDSIMTNNEKRFGKEQAAFKNMEMIRGIAIGAGFSVLGWKIRDFFHHDAAPVPADTLYMPQDQIKPIELETARTGITEEELIERTRKMIGLAHDKLPNTDHMNDVHSQEDLVKGKPKIAESVTKKIKKIVTAPKDDGAGKVTVAQYDTTPKINSPTGEQPGMVHVNYYEKPPVPNPEAGRVTVARYGDNSNVYDNQPEGMPESNPPLGHETKPEMGIDEQARQNSAVDYTKPEPEKTLENNSYAKPVHDDVNMDKAADGYAKPEQAESIAERTSETFKQDNTVEPGTVHEDAASGYGKPAEDDELLRGGKAETIPHEEPQRPKMEIHGRTSPDVKMEEHKIPEHAADEHVKAPRKVRRPIFEQEKPGETRVNKYPPNIFQRRTNIFERPGTVQVNRRFSIFDLARRRNVENLPAAEHIDDAPDVRTGHGGGEIGNNHQNSAEIHADSNDNFYTDRELLNHEELSGELSKLSAVKFQDFKETFNNNIEHAFRNFGSSKWYERADLPVAKEFITYSRPRNADEVLANYISKLHKLTGLEPKSGSMVSLRDTNMTYIAKAILKAQEMGILEKVKLYE
ncbi:MAG: hypothetical protein WDN09_00690 [bacterium]